MRRFSSICGSFLGFRRWIKKMKQWSFSSGWGNQVLSLMSIALLRFSLLVPKNIWFDFRFNFMFWLDVMFLRLILIICFYLILGEINELLPPIFWNIQTILFVLIIVIVYFFSSWYDFCDFVWCGFVETRFWGLWWVAFSALENRAKD